MENETMPCTMCEDGTMKKEGDKMVCDKCGHTENVEDIEKEELEGDM